jgi:hypothetical protein
MMIAPGSPNPLLLCGVSDPLDDIAKIDRSVRLRVLAYLPVGRKPEDVDVFGLGKTKRLVVAPVFIQLQNSRRRG